MRPCESLLIERYTLKTQGYYRRTQAGAELDLLLFLRGKPYRAARISLR